MKFKKILVTALCCSLVFAQTITADAASIKVKKCKATYTADEVICYKFVEAWSYGAGNNGKKIELDHKSNSNQNKQKVTVEKLSSATKKEDKIKYKYSYTYGHGYYVNSTGKIVKEKYGSF